jgi:hypothetical protein
LFVIKLKQKKKEDKSLKKMKQKHLRLKKNKKPEIFIINFIAVFITIIKKIKRILLFFSLSLSLSLSFLYLNIVELKFYLFALHKK